MRQGEREAYRLHARLPAHQRAVERAKAIIAEHSGYAVATSWGKDSTALVALACEVLDRVVVMNARYPNPAERLPDMDRVRDAALALRGIAERVHYVEVECPGEWEMYERAGRAFLRPTTPEEREAARWWKRSLDAAMAAELDRLGCRGQMLGLRKAESKGREANVNARGVSYTRNDGRALVHPLAHLSARDVWAIHITRDLPYLQIYDEAQAGREHARSGFVWATGQADMCFGSGVMQDWRRCYPVEFDAWMERFPELQQWRE